MPVPPILLAAVLALVAGLPWAASAGAAPRWSPPVNGPPARLFHLGPNSFARGQHRGVDLDAAPGERVRSACGGRVVFAGQVAGAGTVSVRCGRWRVTYAPLEPIMVREGARVGAGRGLGRVGRSSDPRRGGPQGHTGLHLGVRREASRFGYVDPLRFLSGPRRAPPPVTPAPLPRPAPRARPAADPAMPSPGLAPWPVWVGLALLMTGLAGAGRLRFSVQQTGGAACRASSTSSSSPTTPSSP